MLLLTLAPLCLCLCCVCPGSGGNFPEAHPRVEHSCLPKGGASLGGALPERIRLSRRLENCLTTAERPGDLLAVRVRRVRSGGPPSEPSQALAHRGKRARLNTLPSKAWCVSSKGVLPAMGGSASGDPPQKPAHHRSMARADSAAQEVISKTGLPRQHGTESVAPSGGVAWVNIGMQSEGRIVRKWTGSTEGSRSSRINSSGDVLRVGLVAAALEAHVPN
ncbi:unnamed protein product [Closterium sp. NIES-65]|nr:unnamed protein product [Closterium sp. NIES-65]